MERKYRYFSPKPTTPPDLCDYNLFSYGPRGGMKFEQREVIRYLRDYKIVFDNGSPRIFDGRIYVELTEMDLDRIIFAAIAGQSPTFVPTSADIRDLLRFAKATLTPDSVYQGYADDNPYEIYGDGELIAFENGVLNTESNEFLDFTASVYLTSYIRAEYNPFAVTCQAQEYLEGIIPEADTRQFFHEMTGYILFNEQMYPPALFNLYGPGNTGKSAIEHLFLSMLGYDNVSQMGIQQVTSRFGTAELEGKRLNICGETGDTSSRITQVDGQLLKRLSDGGRVQVERKGVQPYHIVNTAKFLFCTNTVPDFGDNSSGLYRRLYIIPCRVQQDPNAQIYDKLTDPNSKSWFINRALEAHRELKENKRFSISPQMEKELSQFKTMDGLLDYIQARFETTAPAEVAEKITADSVYSYTTHLYDDYLKYTQEAHSKPLSRKKFVERIRNEYSLTTKKVSVLNEMGCYTTKDKYVKGE